MLSTIRLILAQRIKEELQVVRLGEFDDFCASKIVVQTLTSVAEYQRQSTITSMNPIIGI